MPCHPVLLSAMTSCNLWCINRMSRQNADLKHTAVKCVKLQKHSPGIRHQTEGVNYSVQLLSLCLIMTWCCQSNKYATAPSYCTRVPGAQRRNVFFCPRLMASLLCRAKQQPRCYRRRRWQSMRRRSSKCAKPWERTCMMTSKVHLLIAHLDHLCRRVCLPPSLTINSEICMNVCCPLSSPALCLRSATQTHCVSMRAAC